MIHEIGEILKNQLLTEIYVDKIAGIVQVALDSINENGKPSVKRYPIACNVEGADCLETGRYKDLVPDSKKKSVIFFEDISGVTKTGNTGVRINFEARPRMICWLNKTKLGKTDCAIAPIVVANVIKQLEQIRRRNEGQFIDINVEVLSEVPKSPAIFSNYTFNPYQQYLIYPYEYFALNLKVNFSINPNCIEDFIIGVEDECNTK